jgi:hypothetical protein
VVLIAAHRALLNLVRRLPTREVVAVVVVVVVVYSHDRDYPAGAFTKDVGLPDEHGHEVL